MAPYNANTLLAHDGEAALHQVDQVTSLTACRLNRVGERLVLAADLASYDSVPPYCTLTSSIYHICFVSSSILYFI